ncbi:hypothetical protein SAMN05192562_11216 [Kosakonia arachidis]|uniref:Uncharacterized protein n=1 Tax=Kosakonia arachidis TaxID=551989 RepID=A0A1I7E8D0_9ENTR|nr:hypothetical protein SAMN05192562_11216 [Kosakonia arachidis]
MYKLGETLVGDKLTLLSAIQIIFSHCTPAILFRLNWQEVNAGKSSEGL